VCCEQLVALHVAFFFYAKLVSLAVHIIVFHDWLCFVCITVFLFCRSDQEIKQ
jgi:hypothetical protein